MATTYVRNPNTGEFELLCPGGATTDTTLSQVGKPADAAAVGEALAGYSLKTHEHEGYASIAHEHEGYATVDHTHDGYINADAPTFTSSISMGRKAETEVGYSSVAIGNQCTASLDCTFAIGDGVSATNYGAVALGTDTTASGIYSFAEGYQSKSMGYVSHTEGAYTEAHGDYSHAEGEGTIANVSAQHVQGSYNIKDEDSKYLHIVGNGSSDSSRSNAHTIDKNGNGWFAGTVECTGFILTAPNGTRYQVSVNNSGVLSAIEVVEE